MAGGRENLNLKLETSEFMDQPSVQHDHVVVTIPPATDASSAAIGFQTLNLPSVVPREGVPTDVSTSAANTHGQSPTLQQQRIQWNNPCSWMTLDLYSTSIQIILLVVFVSVFRDEHRHVALQVWAIGYGIGCLATLPLLYCRYKRSREQSNLFRQVSPDSEVSESQTSWRQRFGKILKWLQRLLDGFFVLWFGIGIGIIDTRGASKKAPHLNSLCTVFQVFIYFRYILPWMIYIVMRWCGIRILGLLERPRGASANVILALPTYKFNAAQVSDLETNQANKEDNIRDLIGGDGRVGAPADEVVECCICLDPYIDGVELKELPCTHHFHVKCINRWLKINGSCPICKSEVGTTSRASAMELDVPTVTV